MTESQLKEELNVNFEAAAFMAQTLIPQMKGSTKSVLFFSSIASRMVAEQSLGYHCTKAALEQLTRFLAFHSGQHQVRVNCIRPGFIVQSESRERFYSQENYAKCN